MTYVKGQTINEVVFKSLDKLFKEGWNTPSRNGDTLSIYNLFITLENPRARHLSLKGRKNNIFAMIAETFWVMSGSIEIDPFLTFFLPRARDFSDDGKTWRGGYGTRLYNKNQLEDVVLMFKEDGKFTRRANLYIGDPNLDTKQALKEVYGLENTKDKPCNQLLNFYITPDNKFHMNAFSRSGDIIWGLGSINIFEWTFLQEFLRQAVSEAIGEELELGTYNHFVTNAHLYEFTKKQGYNVVKNALDQKFRLKNTTNMAFPDIDDFKKFFQDLTSYYSTIIETPERKEEKEILQGINDIFNSYKVPTDNLLFDYANLVAKYILAKLEYQVEPYKMKIREPEVLFCLQNSYFRIFEII